VLTPIARPAGLIYVLACGSGVFSRGSTTRSQLAGWILAFGLFSLGGANYTAGHALWHLVSFHPTRPHMRHTSTPLQGFLAHEKHAPP
jgi:hypothetical protein